MSARTLCRTRFPVGRAIPAIWALLLSAGLGVAQVTVSAGPPLLHQLRSIYVVPSADDLAFLVKARLEKWNAVAVTSKPEDADAILTCQTSAVLIPAKVVFRRTIAEVTLVDRRSQKLIWKTSKAATYDASALADDIVEQLTKDWRKSAGDD